MNLIMKFTPYRIQIRNTVCLGIISILRNILIINLMIISKEPLDYLLLIYLLKYLKERFICISTIKKSRIRFFVSLFQYLLMLCLRKYKYKILALFSSCMYDFYL